LDFKNRIRDDVLKKICSHDFESLGIRVKIFLNEKKIEDWKRGHRLEHVKIKFLPDHKNFWREPSKLLGEYDHLSDTIVIFCKPVCEYSKGAAQGSINAAVLLKVLEEKSLRRSVIIISREVEEMPKEKVTPLLEQKIKETIMKVLRDGFFNASAQTITTEELNSLKDAIEIKLEIEKLE
jgi:hypothetical protein